jgi:hypothetical protein
MGLESFSRQENALIREELPKQVCGQDTIAFRYASFLKFRLRLSTGLIPS